MVGDYSSVNGWTNHAWTQTSGDTEEVCINPSQKTYPDHPEWWGKASGFWVNNTNYQVNIDLR